MYIQLDLVIPPTTKFFINNPTDDLKSLHTVCMEEPVCMLGSILHSQKKG